MINLNIIKLIDSRYEQRKQERLRLVSQEGFTWGQMLAFGVGFFFLIYSTIMIESFTNQALLSIIPFAIVGMVVVYFNL